MIYFQAKEYTPSPMRTHPLILLKKNEMTKVRMEDYGGNGCEMPRKSSMGDGERDISTW